MQYKRLLDKQKAKFNAEEASIPLLKPSSQEVIYNTRENELAYKPQYKPAKELTFAGAVGGLGGVTDFEEYNKREAARKADRTMITSALSNQSMTQGQIDTTAAGGDTNLESIQEFENENDMSRMTDMETIAPARGVAE